MRLAWQLVLASVAFVLMFGACSSLAGCGPHPTAEASYTLALLRCVDQAATLAESRACRAQVDAAYHVDGGRP